MSNKVKLIFVADNDTVIATQIAHHFSTHNIDVEIVQEEKERGLTIDDLRESKIIIEPYPVLDFPFFDDGKSARNKRRAAQRKAKKKRKY